MCRRSKNKPKKDKKPIEVVNVLAEAGISNVGGRSYDLVLANHFAEEIDK